MEYNYDYNSDMYTNQLYTTSSEVSPETAAATAAIAITAIVVGLLALIIAYVVFALLLGKIFKKANVPSWIAWVPIYNNWKMLEIGGQQGFWSVLALIPFVNYVSLVFMYIAMYHIGKKLQKEGTFVLFGIFLPIVWYIWLAVDKSKWDDKASTAPSLHISQPTPSA